MDGAWLPLGATGASAELAALLRAVCDAEIGGVARFQPWDCRALAAAVLGRSYAPDLLELCHLAVAAHACGRGREGFEALFWGSGLARAANLRGFMAARVDRHGWRRAGLALEGGGVSLAAPDGRCFTVNYGRMPYLCALMDFAVSALGFAAVDAILASLFDGGAVPPAASVAAAANALARALHAFLKDHLAGQQGQRKFKALMDHLAGRLGADFDPVQVDDGAVLSFWLERGSEGDEDFRTFESVVSAFLALVPALTLALRHARLAAAKPTGKDGEAGEIDPDLLSVPLAAIAEEEWADPLAELADPPAAAVKFLNKQEVADLAPLVAPGPTALRLPLSVLRAQVWGGVQRRLTEALRGQAGLERLRAILAEPLPRDYAGWQTRLAQLDEHMDKALLAALHALAKAGSRHAAALALELEPGLDARRVAARFGVVVPFGRSGMAAPGDDTGIEALLGTAEKAWKSLGRQGFDRLPDGDDPLCAAFESGAPAVMRVRGAAARMGARLQAMDAVGRFPADRETFCGHLARLYGDSP